MSKHYYFRQRPAISISEGKDSRGKKGNENDYGNQYYWKSNVYTQNSTVGDRVSEESWKIMIPKGTDRLTDSCLYKILGSSKRLAFESAES